ncbi:MAG TPA: glycosyltransferase family 39 protein [Thermomicrobiaceae bacterium]|nr:glycosyltransferase family 39 protein [Thermomicrobiaceae bacterium]
MIASAAEIVTGAAPEGAVRRDAARTRWERPALLLLLGATALLYLWQLGASGWANAFYSAAAQAETHSWSALFFGSFDSANFITVDKPPAALWLMALSARLFGVNPWSILAPEALCGVAAVGLLYATVRRWFAPAAALLAGAVLALTPVAALMFRFNNPDALLVLLLVAAAYALTRAVEDGRTRWLLLAGALIGLGFLTKMLQAFLVVPPFALVYLLAGPGSLALRLRQLLTGGLAMLLAGGWWVAAMILIPAGSRPFIGGSQDNSILNLIFGYNGFGRLDGNEAGSVGGGPPGTSGRWGPTGLLRLFGSEMGSQVSWLLPAALIALAALLWLSWRGPRTDRPRAAALLWGGWLLLTGLTFSLAQGIIHPYYTVALAPAIGALVGIGAVELWQRRDRWGCRLLLAAAVAASASWAFVLLDRSPNWYPPLRVGVLVVGIAAALALLGVDTLRRRSAATLGAVALAVALAGPAAFAAQTAATPHTGAIPSAGPAPTRGRATGGRASFPSNFGGVPRTGPFGNGNQGTARGSRGGNARSQSPRGLAGQFGPGGIRGGLGGLLNANTPSSALISLLRQGSAGYTWAAATVGANDAAGVQLALNAPVMAIGGFNGTDPAPTLAEFQSYVRAGKVHYFIASGGLAGGFAGFGRPAGPAGSSDTAAQITRWVAQTFAASSVGGVTVYDLSHAR